MFSKCSVQDLSEEREWKKEWENLVIDYDKKHGLYHLWISDQMPDYVNTISHISTFPKNFF